MTDSYWYTAFGEELASTGTTSNEFRYTGEQLDPNTQFYYLRARWMKPSTGRFMSVDPLLRGRRPAPMLPVYAYTNSSPVTYVDPTGLFTMVELAAAIGVDQILPTLARPVYGRDKSFNVGISIHSELFPQHDSWFDMIARKNSDPGKWSSVKGGAELLAQLTSWSIVPRGEIRKLTIAGHGWACGAGRALVPGISGYFSNGENGFYSDRFYNEAKKVGGLASGMAGAACVGDLKRLVRSRAVNFSRVPVPKIQIYSCRIAPSFVQELSAAIGGVAVAASGACRPGDASGTWTSSAGPENQCWSENHDGRYVGFNMSLNGGVPVQIGGEYDPGM